MLLVELGGPRGAVAYSAGAGGRLEPKYEALPPRAGRRLRTVLAEVFLPAGYPESVRPEYLRFQAFDTLQAACSYLRSILTTSAILRGAGVGESAASPMAAAAAWVLRDGFGMFGSLLFSYSVSTGFDQNVKEWRLFADLINDVGLTLDMLAPLTSGPSAFATVAALGAACKTICGMVAGATRASIGAHLSLGDNLADVSAKEGAQEAAVTLAGLVLGSLFAGHVGDSLFIGWLIFVALTAVHVWANWRGVGCLAFRWLNLQRATLVAAAWAERGAMLTPEQVAAEERLWRPLLLSAYGPKLRSPVHELCSSAEEVIALTELYGTQRYVLRHVHGRAHIMLRSDATGADALKALLQCALHTQPGQTQGKGAHAGAAALSEAERASLAASLAAVEREWPRFSAAMVSCWGGQTAIRGFEGGLRYQEGDEHSKKEG